MKKILLSLAVALTTTFSQSQVIYSASGATEFQAGTIFDADGDSSNWGIYDLMLANGGQPVGTSFDSQGEVLGSFSWDSIALTPDNWFITPAINLTGISNPSLSWGRASVDPDFAAENYSVYAVTAADPQALALALQTATPLFTETIGTGDEWLTKSASLSGLANQNNVYVAFRHHACTDMFLLILDDIKVENVASVNENELNISVYPNPANNVLNINIDGEISNVTISTLDGKVVKSASSSVVNVSDLTSGIYIYKVTAEGKVSTGNFVKN